jgi:hypothetical protein
VFPRGRWCFHTCVVCGRRLDLKSPSAETCVGPECARNRGSDEIGDARERALAADRTRYRNEVLADGFKAE